jgi:hypothetical protein
MYFLTFSIFNRILILLFFLFSLSGISQAKTIDCLKEYNLDKDIISKYMIRIEDGIFSEGCDVIPVYSAIIETENFAILDEIEENPKLLGQLKKLFSINSNFSTLLSKNKMIKKSILMNSLNENFLENFTYLVKKKLRKKEIREIEKDINYLNYGLLASLYAKDKKEGKRLYREFKTSISIELMSSFVLILDSVGDEYTFGELLESFTLLSKELSAEEVKELAVYPQYFAYFLYPKKEALSIETISSSQLKEIQRSIQKRVIYIYHALFEKYRYEKGVSPIDYALLTVENMYPYLLESYRVDEDGFKKLFYHLVRKNYIISLFKEDKCSKSSKENFAVFGKGNIESAVKLLRKEKELVSTLFSEFKNPNYSIMSFFYVANLYGDLDSKGWKIFKELLETLPYEYDNKIVFIQKIERAGYFRNIVTQKDYKNYIDSSYGNNNPKYKYILLTPYPSQNDMTLFDTVLNTNISNKLLQRSLVDLIRKNKKELERHEFTKSEKFFGNIDRLDTALTVASIGLAPFTGGISLTYVASNMGSFASKKIISNILKKVVNKNIKKSKYIMKFSDKPLTVNPLEKVIGYVGTGIKGLEKLEDENIRSHVEGVIDDDFVKFFLYNNSEIKKICK